MHAHSERELLAEVGRLRAMLADTQAMLPLDWRLTPGEERAFRALLAHDCVTPAILMEVAQTTAGTIRVVMHRIRTKLKPRGVEIETLLGKGWRLIGREQWVRILAPATTEGVN